jgi:hypothetical protein
MAKIKTYSVPDEDIQTFEKILFDLGRKDRWSDSRIILEAVREYGKNHLPGNPQLPITNFNGQEQFSISATEKLKPIFQQMQVITCPQCQGAERTIPCLYCAGKGTITEWK